MPDPLPPPDEAALHVAALAYLARHAATRTTLTRLLDRRVDRWARGVGAAEPSDVAAMAATARLSVRAVVARLVTSGVVDDAAFAASRAHRLTRQGHSRAATAAHLAARGIAGEAARQALPDDADTEFAAAVAFLRRRRFGPFRTVAADPERAGRELAALARAGFGRAAAVRALNVSADEAVDVLARLHVGRSAIIR